MHKVKRKKNIIIQTNQPIRWVKSTLYDGLNKQPNVLDKIIPKCVLSYIYPALGLKTTQCFLEYAEFFVRKRHPIFLGLFYKKANICIYC